MAFGSLAEIVRRAKQTGGSFAGVMIELDCRERQTDRLESFTRMKEMYRAMQQADQSYDSELSSASGLVGGSGKRLDERIASGESLCGELSGTVAAMRSIGVCMAPARRETGEGGLAATPTGIRIAKEIQG